MTGQEKSLEVESGPRSAGGTENVDMFAAADKLSQSIDIYTQVMRAKVAERDRKIIYLLEALSPFVEGAAHTRVFLVSREKMNPVGVEIYDAAVEQARAAISKATS